MGKTVHAVVDMRANMCYNSNVRILNVKM